MNNQGSPAQDNILTGQTERIASVNPSTSVRILAKITAGATFLLILAGSLVTGNKAALSDPTWPKFVGHWIPHYFVGGLRFEDSHRIIAAVVGILTLILALVIQFHDPRRFMKKLGWAAFVLIVLQALVGGLVVKTFRLPVVSMAHAILAQAFFCTTIALAVLSSKTWFRDRTLPPVVNVANRGYLAFMKFAVLVVYLQVIMGTGVRHSNDAVDMFVPFLLAHISGAFAVIFVVIWFNLRTWHVYRDVAPLRRSSLFAAGLVIFQITFGILTVFANRARLLPEMAQVHDIIASSTHVLGGTTLLALMVGTTLRAYRLLDLTVVSHIPSQAYQTQEVKA